MSDKPIGWTYVILIALAVIATMIYGVNSASIGWVYLVLIAIAIIASVYHEKKKDAKNGFDICMFSLRAIRYSVDDAIKIYRDCPYRLKVCYRHLDKAQTHFKNRSYTPFWKSIEDCVVSLNEYYQVVESLTEKMQGHSNRLEKLDQELKRYSVELKELGDDTNVSVKSILTFPFSEDHIRALKASDDVSHILSEMTSKAHTIYEFASIYEQRRTTAAVIAGFKSLTEAVEKMGDRIVASVDRLAEVTQAGFNDVSGRISSLESAQESRGEISHHESSYDRELRESLTQCAEILDDMHRGYKPILRSL